MARTFGVDPDRTDARADTFAEAVSAAMERVARSTARGLPDVPSELDLAGVRGAWRRQVEDVLLPLVEREWRRAADDTWANVARLIEKTNKMPAVVGAVTVNDGIASVPKIPIEAARTYLESANNRLVHIGDELWDTMRSDLLAGLKAGEGSADLAHRIRQAPGITKARATVIARTEVIGATNRGAYSQMIATGLNGTKEWLATNDGRTRPSHAAANGETVAMKGTFSVGGHGMDGPHDPTAPPGETINCRCTLVYDIADEVTTIDLTAAQPEVETVSQVATTPRVMNVKEAKEWGQTHFERGKDLPPDEREAMKRYAGGGYQNINKRARGLQVGPSNAKQADLDIAEIDSVMKRNVVPEDVVVSRAVQLDVFKGDPSKYVGKVLKDKGYLSTSIGEKARGAPSRFPVQMRIEVPKGTHGYYMRDVTTFKEENELLLARGQTLAITNAEYRGGKWYVTAKIVKAR